MDAAKQLTIDAYNLIARDFNERNYHSIYVKEFEKFKKLIKGVRVLEIGCGAGRDAELFTQNKFDYVGIDASSEMLKIAKKRVPDGEFKEMDFYKLEFPDGAFDGFWAAASFLHVPKKDVDKLITEAVRVTREGGVGFVTVKEKTGLDEGVIEQNLHGGIKRYFAFYSEEEFRGVLVRNGLEILEVSHEVENDERKTRWFCYLVRKPEIS